MFWYPLSPCTLRKHSEAPFIGLKGQSYASRGSSLKIFLFLFLLPPLQNDVSGVSTLGHHLPMFEGIAFFFFSSFFLFQRCLGKYIIIVVYRSVTDIYFSQKILGSFNFIHNFSTYII